ncbi:hypothetical protein BVX93_00865, partial [bacterium B13(2017)]
MNQCIILFLKYPLKNKVKTRLSKDLDADIVTKLYECFVFDILSEIKKTEIALKVYYTQIAPIDNYKKWLGDSIDLTPQKGKNLGEKLQNAFLDVYNCGFNKVVTIGSDIPSITSFTLKKAFCYLDTFNGVIGPCFDGGYYLIGINKQFYNANIFENINWSSNIVFSQTIEK